MSIPTKGPKRFTPTTVILILILLGAVAGASRLISPPPPGPPVEKKEDPGAAAARQKQMTAMQEEERRKNEQMMKQNMKSAEATIPKVADPNTVDVDPTYFIHHKPGEAGLKQMDAEMAKKRAAFEDYKRKVAASKGTGVVPQDKPIAVPAK